MDKLTQSLLDFLSDPEDFFSNNVGHLFFGQITPEPSCIVIQNADLVNGIRNYVIENKTSLESNPKEFAIGLKAEILKVETFLEKASGKESGFNIPDTPTGEQMLWQKQFTGSQTLQACFFGAAQVLVSHTEELAKPSSQDVTSQDAQTPGKPDKHR